MKKNLTLLIGTNNKGKLKEIRELLPKSIKTKSTTDFNLNTGDWTVEWFAYPTSDTQYQRYFYLVGSNASQIEGIFADSNGIAFGRTSVWASSAATNPLNQWNHYALVHDSTNMRLYINGTQVLTSTDNFVDENKSLNIGYSNGSFGGHFTGKLSNFRIVRKSAIKKEISDIKNIPEYIKKAKDRKM